jgi:hypothetical protein
VTSRSAVRRRARVVDSKPQTSRKTAIHTCRRTPETTQKIK